MIEIEEIHDILYDKNISGVFKDKQGWKWSLLKGEYHSYNNIPAVETTAGYKVWYWKGLEHKDNGPARIKRRTEIHYNDGIEEFWYYGHNADDEKEFYNKEWRRKIEIKLFL